MLNGLNPLSSSALGSILSSGADPLTSALGGSSAFDSIFTQAMNQAKTPGEKMQDALMEVQYNNLNTLYDAVSGDNSSPTDALFGSSLGMLGMDLGSVSAQVNQLEQLLGMAPASSSNASGQPASNMNAAMGLEAQMLLNQDIANFGGGSGSSVDSLV